MPQGWKSALVNRLLRIYLGTRAAGRQLITVRAEVVEDPHGTAGPPDHYRGDSTVQCLVHMLADCRLQTECIANHSPLPRCCHDQALLSQYLHRAFPSHQRSLSKAPCKPGWRGLLSLPSHSSWNAGRIANHSFLPRRDQAFAISVSAPCHPIIRLTASLSQALWSLVGVLSLSSRSLIDQRHSNFRPIRSPPFPQVAIGCRIYALNFRLCMVKLFRLLSFAARAGIYAASTTAGMP
jgi:hypothetical protein